MTDHPEGTGARWFPEDSTERKNLPITSGVLDYFPNALREVARVSKFGNDKHNPGQPLHWSRGKSNDHRDCVVRHIMQAGEVSDNGIRHSAEAAWRALANLEEELIAAGATPGRGTTAEGLVFEGNTAPVERETSGGGHQFRRVGFGIPEAGQYYLNPVSLEGGRLLISQRGPDSLWSDERGRVLVELVR